MLRWIVAGIVGISLLLAGKPALAGKAGSGFKIGDGWFEGVNTSIAALGDGGFVVTWTTQAEGGPFGDYYPNYARSYTADGQAVGNAIVIGEGGDFGVPYGSSVIGIKNGGFFAFYSDGFYQGQRYTAAGKSVGKELFYDGFHSVAELAKGGFVIAHDNADCSACTQTVYGRKYTDAGVAIGAPVAIHSGLSFTSVAALAGGGFVATWSDTRPGTGYDVYAQRFSATATPIGGTFQVNTFTAGDQTAPVVAGLANGSFVVTWVSKGRMVRARASMPSATTRAADGSATSSA